MKLADLGEIEQVMQKAVESTKRAFNTIRTGRANTSLLDRISVGLLRRPDGAKIPR